MWKAFCGGLVLLAFIIGVGQAAPRGNSAPRPAPYGVAQRAVAVSSVRSSIVSIAKGQVGVKDNPSTTYCNPYTGYWGDGTSSGCARGNRAIEWCADFAAWAWKKAGITFTYGSGASDINASSSSFYKWGVAHGTWHSIGSGYAPQPGDVAVYGSVPSNAQHVGIYLSGSASSPTVVNGDWEINYPSAWPTAVATKTNEGASNPGDASSAISGYVAPDVGPPTPPGNPQVSSVGSDGSAVLSWSASTDDVAVQGYALYVGSSRVAAVASSVHSYRFAGLNCAASNSLSVRAYDPSAQYSSAATVSGILLIACARSNALNHIVTVSPSATSYFYDGTYLHWIPDPNTYYCVLDRPRSVYTVALQAIADQLGNGRPPVAGCLSTRRVVGHIVRESSSGTAYKVIDNHTSYGSWDWISNGSLYNCLVRHGWSVINANWTEINSLRGSHGEHEGVHATCP